MTMHTNEIDLDIVIPAWEHPAQMIVLPQSAGQG
jgi:hypothetical protein